MNNQELKEFVKILEALGLPKKLYYSKAESARLIGVAHATIDRWAKEETCGLHQIKVGDKRNNRVLIPIDSLCDFWINSKKM